MQYINVPKQQRIHLPRGGGGGGLVGPGPHAQTAIVQSTPKPRVLRGMARGEGGQGPPCAPSQCLVPRV